MSKYKLYVVTREAYPYMGATQTQTEYLGITVAKNKDEAISKGSGIGDLSGRIVRYNAKPIKVEGFKITLTSLEQKVSS